MDIFGKTKAELMPRYLFYSAICVDYEKAIKADIGKQNYSVCPRFWYADAIIKCECCNENFTFSKEKQKMWYEDYKFWVDSFPKTCSLCKKYEKELHNEINYVRTQWCKPEKRERVLEELNKIIQKFGFVPHYMANIPDQL